MNGWVRHLEKVAEARYGRGTSVEVDVSPNLHEAGKVVVAIVNAQGGTIVAATCETRTAAVLTLLRSFGEKVVFE